MLGEVGRHLQRLYPSRTWGELDAAGALGGGISDEDGQALAEELSVELEAATVFSAGAEHQLCNFVYVLCVGREPCALQIRDGGAPMPRELQPDTVLAEQYLRIALSAVAPLAAVQQVAVDLSNQDQHWWLREAPRAGVYDAPLLRRFQRLVALLPAYGITHVDFGEISAPPEGYASGAYSELYGGEPHQVNYLFYPEPSTLVVTAELDTEENAAPG